MPHWLKQRCTVKMDNTDLFFLGMPRTRAIPQYRASALEAQYFFHDAANRTAEETAVNAIFGPGGELQLTTTPIHVEDGYIIAGIGSGNTDAVDVRHRNIMARTLRQIMRTQGGEEFTKTSTALCKSGLFTIAYGPDPDEPPSTHSADMRRLVCLLAPFRKRISRRLWSLYRLERFRLIVIDPNCTHPTVDHRLTLKLALNTTSRGATVYTITKEWQPAVNCMHVPVSVHAHPKCDLVRKYAMGFGDVHGRAEESRHVESTRRSIVQDPRSQCLLLLLPQCDSWTIHTGMGRGRYTLGMHTRRYGIVNLYGELAARSPELEALRASLSTLRPTLPLAAQFGIIGNELGDPADEDSGDNLASMTLQRAEFKFRDHTTAHLTSLRCAGVPVVQGFVRLMPSGALPPYVEMPHFVSYTQVCSVGALGGLGASEIAASTDSVVVFELGDSIQLLCEHDRRYYADSGRLAGSVLGAIDAFRATVDSSAIVGVCGSGISSTTLVKITSLCGNHGFCTWATALPGEIQRRLRRFTPENRDYNASIVESLYLNVHSPSVLLAVSCSADTGGRRSPMALLKLVCRAFGCPVREVGWRTQTRGIFIFDDRPRSDILVNEPLHLNTFRPKYPLATDAVPRHDNTTPTHQQSSSISDDATLHEVLLAILRHPTVGSKEFILRHTDRCTNGRVAQQPGVGPLDTPVADFATFAARAVDDLNLCSNLWQDCGEGRCRVYSEMITPGVCTAIGENAVLMAHNPERSAMRSITEAMLGLALSPTDNVFDTLVSATITWPHRRGFEMELDRFMDTCKNFCRNLGVCFQVSSCKASNLPGGATLPNANVVAAVFTAASTCEDVNRKLTPDLKQSDSTLVFAALDNTESHSGSIIQQISGKVCGEVAAIDARKVKELLVAIANVRRCGYTLSGHDVSDGGLWGCLVEMAISGDRTVSIHIPQARDPLSYLTSEAAGIVLEVPRVTARATAEAFASRGLYAAIIGKTGPAGSSAEVTIYHGQQIIFRESLHVLRAHWTLFATRQAILSRDESMEPLNEDAYGRDTMVLPTIPYSLVGLPNQYHYVTVFMLPGATRPDGIMSALANAGFAPVLMGVDACNADSLYNANTLGICIVGDSNFVDSELGDRAMAYYTHSTRVVATELRKVLAQQHTFSLAIGSMACEVLFQGRYIGFDPATNTQMTCRRNASRMYESRWLNIHIPQNTRAIAFRGLAGALLPCWAQGERLGFDHPAPGILNSLERENQIASIYYGRDLTSGPAHFYPRNPAEGSAIAGVCSPDGRHLALLHDPTLACNLWQWPYVPPCNVNVAVSPWRQMFYSLHHWSLSKLDEVVRLQEEAAEGVDDFLVQGRGDIGPGAAHQMVNVPDAEE
uniref:Uncharacterized protein n=1 Tax=Otarine gammaherpesvirus 4 TaxID=2801541 RepID=A0A889IVX3_9GAMA|nr:hypothetical protein [Otarine gammaherpesvirus 4]